MSSRALRKLQKEQEIQRQLALAKAAEEEYEEEVFMNINHSAKPINAFDMLEDHRAEDETEDEEDVDAKPSQPGPQTTPATIMPGPSKTKKKRKSKKKTKGKAVEPATNGAEVEDDVDRALKELATKNMATSTTEDGAEVEEHEGVWEAKATSLLGVDAKNLNPVNEMKSLFGNIALEASESRAAPPQRRREQNQQGGVDLETALTGRYSPASKGKELGTMAKRRNTFMQGKEEWPLATSGGLSMEHLPNERSFEKWYAIIHNNQYSDTQHQFRLCVETMDPQNLIRLLTLHPYHISTLLQVSEIAKHQGDHSVSGDLLERALFSLGRSVHSTFPRALREGKARLAYDKPENRELYLAIWRYIRNLEMRGTWKTAFEWTKLLLQLDTRSDPCGATMMIDQFALRGRQHHAFIGMCSPDAYGMDWFHLPNVQISLALAYQRASQPKLARQTLAVAMHKYPFVLSALATALDISPLPRMLWAKLPTTDAEKLYTELYATRAKDLWSTPEATSLISEVAETLSHYTDIIKSAPDAPLIEISLEEARHIMLLEVPSLIALLPRKFTNMPTSSSDVLPPPSASSSFTARVPGSASSTTTVTEFFASAVRAATRVTARDLGASAAVPTSSGGPGPLSRLLSWFSSPTGPPAAEHTEAERQLALRELGEQMGGVPADQVEGLLNTLMDPEHHPEPTVLNNERHLADMYTSDFDYYEDMNSRFTDEESGVENEGEDHDAESMPDPGSVSGDEAELTVPASDPTPRQATVEDDPDEPAPRLPGATHDGPILRPINDLAPGEQDTDRRPVNMTHPEPSHTLFAAHAPHASPATAEPPFDTTDPQRVQRWLLSTGLENLQSDPSSLDTYIARLKTLRKPQQDWIVSIVRQGAGGAEVAERIRDALY